MPNHCTNIIKLIYHEDPQMIRRLANALNEKRFFSEFLPCPEEVDCRKNFWGTACDTYDISLQHVTKYAIQCSFTTAWTPPLEAYLSLKELGFKINAMFAERGGDFCGYWIDGKETVFYEARKHILDTTQDFYFYLCDDTSDT
jgi:hypothetical protein